jgi:hypothetical protein
MSDEPPDSTTLPALIVALRDGTPVRIRLVRPDDRARLLRGVGEMSRTSRYMCFFATMREMSDEQARYLTEIVCRHFREYATQTIQGLSLTFTCANPDPPPAH